jgi:hypothetical protein
MLAGTYDKDLLSFEVAKVISVDTANWLCTAQLVSGTVQTTYTNIQLTAEQASNGFIQVPKVSRNVILAITWRNEVYVFMCSEIDALVFHQKNTDGSYEEFVINCNANFNSALPLGIQLVDGGGNGVVITSGTGAPSNSSNGIVINNSSNPPSNSSNGILISCSGTMQFNDGSYGGLVIGGTPQGLQAQINNLNAQVQALINVINGVPPIPTATAGSPDALQAALQAAVTGLSNADFSNIINANITHGPSVS